MKTIADAISPPLRIGVDLGGTKIEALALDAEGREVLRRRVATPREDYHATLETYIARSGDRLGIGSARSHRPRRRRRAGGLCLWRPV